MARVPVPAGNVVALQPMNDAKFRAADNGGGALGGLGEGLQKLGGAVSQRAEVQNDIDAQFDEASAKGVLAEYSGFRNQQLYTGDKAFSQTSGQSALAARMPVEKSLDDKIGELSARLTTPRAKHLFGQAVRQERERDGLAIGTHAVEQTKIWNDQNDSALQGQAGQDFIGATLRGDDDGAKMAMGTLTNSITAQYGRNGLSGAPAQQALARAVSGVRSSVVDAKTLTDPVGAAAYIHDNEADFLPADLAKLNASLYRPLLERQAAADVTTLMASGADTVSAAMVPPVAAPVPGGGSTVARMVAITQFSESRNRDRDANGRVLTSSAGAEGRMQVMPTTNTDPGYGVRPAADGSDGERARVGRDYIAALTKHYGGDPAKGWAAYNWGPGNFDNAMRKHGGDVAAVLSDPKTPKETRDYVSKNVAMLGGTTATPTYAPRRDDLGSLYAKIDAQPWDFERKKAAREQVDHIVSRDDRMLARQQTDAFNQAITTTTQLGDNFTSVSQISPAVLRNLSPQAVASLTSQAQQNAKPKPIAANSDTVINLHQLANLDPEAFKKRDLRLDRPNMTAGEYDQLATTQTAMLAKPNSTAEISHSKIWGTISRFAADVGLDLGTKGGKPNNPKDRADSMRLFSTMQGTLQAITDGKRAPTDDEIKKAFDNAVMPIAHTKSGWFGNSTEMVPRFRDAERPTNSIAVPKDQHDRIAAGLRARGMPYDDQSVARFYIQAKR